ncbi:unnamed protein product [Gulo gulo]|uniref:Uncharacterized protein n=1 Tax=Gulo gulo TaxID=48420 RepID=A0A9X9LLW0_GULGU|nr:unnamed protein product [Gulo gulo]
MCIYFFRRHFGSENYFRNPKAPTQQRPNSAAH